MSKTLVLVEGLSSGAQLPPMMREHGWRSVHVRSLPNLSPYFLASFRPDDYVARFSYEGDIRALARDIEPYEPSAVLPGTEPGVIVADLLADALGLPGNDPSCVLARRDKYEMHNRVRAAGLRGMDHYLATDVDGLLGWARGGSWPVVIKPQAAGGTDSVTFCADPDELAAGFQRLHRATNQFGNVNEAVLAQRFLSGTEYFINGISGNGTHVITEIWRADKIPVPGASLIYDRSVLFDPTEPDLKQMVGYVHDVLDALGVRYGPHHTEVIVTDEGPTLVEVGARLSGGLHRPPANHAVGASQLDLTASLLLEGPSFVERLAADRKPHHAPLWQIQFISNHTGEVAESFYEERIATLRSKTWIQRAPKPGDRVTRTTDLFSSPGIVFLSHPDPDVLQADYETVREWERTDQLFTVR